MHFMKNNKNYKCMKIAVLNILVVVIFFIEIKQTQLRKYYHNNSSKLSII